MTIEFNLIADAIHIDGLYVLTLLLAVPLIVLWQTQRAKNKRPQEQTNPLRHSSYVSHGEEQISPGNRKQQTKIQLK